MRIFLVKKYFLIKNKFYNENIKETDSKDYFCINDVT